MLPRPFKVYSCTELALWGAHSLQRSSHPDVLALGLDQVCSLPGEFVKSPVGSPALASPLPGGNKQCLCAGPLREGRTWRPWKLSLRERFYPKTRPSRSPLHVRSVFVNPPLVETSLQPQGSTRGLCGMRAACAPPAVPLRGSQRALQTSVLGVLHGGPRSAVHAFC